MDRLDAIRTLLAAVDSGSLSAAARRLNTPLPTVSRKVSDLETYLGTQLVVRTSRKLVVTDAGQAFIAAGRRVLEDLEEAERAASGEYRTPRGDLLITASLKFGAQYLTPVILEFLRAYPDVNVRTLFADHVVDLVENHVDAAIRIGRLPDSALVAQRVGDTQWTICASPAYLARHGTPLTPADLASHVCIAFEGLQRARTWPFGRGTASVQMPIEARFAGNTADTVLAAAQAGIGIARLLSYQAAGAIEAGHLVPLLTGYAPEPMAVHLVHPAMASVPLKLRVFLDFAGPHLRTALRRAAASCAPP